MANFEIPEKPEYSEEIRKFEEEDPGHADLFNAVVETLLNNEVFLKKLADSLAKSISGLNTLTKYTTVQTPNPSMGAQIVQKENTELDMETGLPFPFPIQEVVAGHELALRQLNTDMLKACIIYCKNSDDNHVLFIGDIPLRYQGLVKGCIASTLGYWGNLSVGSIQISSTKIQIETNAQDTNIYTVPFSCVFILG